MSDRRIAHEILLMLDLKVIEAKRAIVATQMHQRGIKSKIKKGDTWEYLEKRLVIEQEKEVTWEINLARRIKHQSFMKKTLRNMK